MMDPLFPQYRDEGHEQRDGQTGEEDRLSPNNPGGDIRDWCQRVGPTKRRVLLQYPEQKGVRQIGGVWLELWNNLHNERGSDGRE